MEINTKVNKWNLIKFKSSCIGKKTVNKVKIKPSEWDKIIANQTTGKGLISKIYKQLINNSIPEKKKKQSKSGKKT